VAIESLTSPNLRRLFRDLDPSLWGRLVVQGLQNFVPSCLYLDGPSNTSNQALRGLTGRDRFPDEAADCDDRLASALQDSGLEDVSWTRAGLEASPSFPSVSGDSLLVRRSRADFVAWAEAFRCDGCGKPGEVSGTERGGVSSAGSLTGVFHIQARRQCASCAELLCLDCSICCPVADSESRDRCVLSSQRHTVHHSHLNLLAPGRCAFALCRTCHSDNSFHGAFVTRIEVYRADVPGFSPSVCVMCPPRALHCPLHVDCCILECDECDDRRCMAHLDGNMERGFPPIYMRSCMNCPFMVCGRASCLEASDAAEMTVYCSKCDYMSCTRCTPDRVCCGCHKRMPALSDGRAF
jgi:hypothetical protein